MPPPDKRERRARRVYGPADLARIFRVSRTTLFRWEEEKKISPVPRDTHDRRVYSDGHRSEIEMLLREHRRRIEAQKRRSLGDGYRQVAADGEFELSLLRSYLAGHQRLLMLDHLAAWASTGKMSDGAIRELVGRALALKRGDEEREMVWSIMGFVERAALGSVSSG